MFGKIDVNGLGVYLFYKWLILEKFGVFGIGVIKWNFIKFLLCCDGMVYKCYVFMIKLEEIVDDIEWLLVELDFV